MDIVFIFSLLPIAFILWVVAIGLIKKVDVYTAFVEGAKQGMQTAVKVLPYMIAMMVAIAVFRQGGLLTIIEGWIEPALDIIDAPKEVGPLFLLRPFSGSAALSMLSEIYTTTGVDSYASDVASVMMGSTETIFYTVAIYFAAVGVEKTRHTIWAALIASVVGLVASVYAVKIFL